MHRDLKPSNILITQHCTVKLCDFGLSRCIPAKTLSNAKSKQLRPLSPVCTTRFYRAPEVIFQQQRYDSKIDIWSFGCLVSEIMKKTLHSNLQSPDLILFRGEMCYPISPIFNDEPGEEEATIHYQD
jgi:mitogen-activated protein kinase 1/3